MSRTTERLRREIDSSNRSAQAHSQNAAAAQNTVNALTGQIDAANAAIQYARDFKNGALKNLRDQNDALIKSLKSLGDEAGKGIGCQSACSNAKDISSGNAGVLDTVGSQCDSIIGRLQGQVAGWSNARTAAQNQVNAENDAARSCSQAAAHAQGQLWQMQN
ncbi:hypothetical protein OZX62_07475 [Bifidobacterium sp. ESL0690]|uniref:hypothetical protein n=1 Tax=Bifidobacterium sp. ESL0690 TaxID=2983214 RepID=UPI0023F98FF4|nr:hypothetical protein [Bifidobacterium sp. ESL0690]WEV46278.1 hypothetical protein OZX62_07475 [Bifidobacterium sp. ESL0690]